MGGNIAANDGLKIVTMVNVSWHVKRGNDVWCVSVGMARVLATVTLRMFVRRMMFAPIRANIREHSVREAEDHFVVLVG